MTLSEQLDATPQTYIVQGNYPNDMHADFAKVRCTWGEALALAGRLLEVDPDLVTVRLARPRSGAGFYLHRDLVDEVA